MPATNATTEKASDDLAIALLIGMIGEAFAAPMRAQKSAKATADATQVAADAEAPQPLTDDEQEDASLIRDVQDDELGAVLTYIRAMPTWGDDTVISVRGWLLDQLRAGKHRTN